MDIREQTMRAWGINYGDYLIESRFVDFETEEVLLSVLTDIIPHSGFTIGKIAYRHYDRQKDAHVLGFRMVLDMRANEIPAMSSTYQVAYAIPDNIHREVMTPLWMTAMMEHASNVFRQAIRDKLKGTELAHVTLQINGIEDWRKIWTEHAIRFMSENPTAFSQGRQR